MGTEKRPSVGAEDGTGREPVQPRGRWAGDMVPRAAGRGKDVRHSGGGGYMSCGTVRLEWVGRAADARGVPLRTRRPCGITMVFPKLFFMAAGRPYFSRAMLTVRRRDDSPWTKDVYGRDVLVLTERFPCFDSADWLYDKRRFRWYFLCCGGKLTRVFHTDGAPFVTVTEDVRDLEAGHWEEMRRMGCFALPGEERPWDLSTSS